MPIRMKKRTRTKRPRIKKAAAATMPAMKKRSGMVAAVLVPPLQQGAVWSLQFWACCFVEVHKIEAAKRKQRPNEASFWAAVLSSTDISVK